MKSDCLNTGSLKCPKSQTYQCRETITIYRSLICDSDIALLAWSLPELKGHSQQHCIPVQRSMEAVIPNNPPKHTNEFFNSAFKIIVCQLPHVIKFRIFKK